MVKTIQQVKNEASRRFRPEDRNPEFKKSFFSPSGLVERFGESRLGSHLGFMTTALTGMPLTAAAAIGTGVAATVFGAAGAPAALLAAGVGTAGAALSYLAGKTVELVTNVVSDEVHEYADNRNAQKAALEKEFNVESNYKTPGNKDALWGIVGVLNGLRYAPLVPVSAGVAGLTGMALGAGAGAGSAILAATGLSAPATAATVGGAVSAGKAAQRFGQGMDKLANSFMGLRDVEHQIREQKAAGIQ